MPNISPANRPSHEPARSRGFREPGRWVAGMGGLIGAALLASTLTWPGEESPLPTEEIALRLRAARIAGLQGNVEDQQVILEAIAREHPEDNSALIALLDLATSLPAGSDAAGRAREALRRLLLDPGRRAPASVMQAFAFDMKTPEQDLHRLAAILSARSLQPPVDPDIFLLLAGIQERLALPQEARATLGRLLEASGDPEVRQRCIHLDIELERWEDALALLTTQRSLIGPDKLRLPAILVFAALGRTKELDAEVAALGKDELLVTHHVLPLLVEVGFSLHDGGLTERAREWFDLLQEKFTDDPTLAMIRSSLYGREAGPGGAGDRTSERAPFDILNEGTALLSAGEAHAAYPLLERAAELLGDNDLAWFNLGLASADLQRWERAEAAFDRSFLLNPRFVRALVQRAQARLRLGRIPEATDDATRALEMDPRSKAAVLILHHCAKARGDERAASELLRRWSSM